MTGRVEGKNMQGRSPAQRRSARGFSLMEMLLATSLSLVVTASMVALMINSLSSTTRIVKMTKLTDDMRMALQLMTRDVRRSNYTADAVNCFANPDCASDGTIAWSGDVQISDDGDCFVFQLDRDFDGDMTENAPGAFRYTVLGGVGAIQMWVGESDPDCASSDVNWALVTDPNDIEITGFAVDDNLSYTEVIWDDGDGNQFFQKVRKLRLSISGQLTSDASITRQIEDVVKLRNNLYL
jgi:type II secretory pathway pseudopilin PulG